MRSLARIAAVAVVAFLASCGGGGDGSASSGGLTLDDFEVTVLAIDGVSFEAWLADSEAQQRRGFMFATEEQLAPLPDGTPRGMLFRFPSDRVLSFFMRDTSVPLDIAYASSEGRIAEVHHLQPLDETSVVSQIPLRYAFEVRAGTFAAHGIGVGDRIALPPR